MSNIKKDSLIFYERLGLMDETVMTRSR